MKKYTVIFMSVMIISIAIAGYFHYQQENKVVDFVTTYGKPLQLIDSDMKESVSVNEIDGGNIGKLATIIQEINPKVDGGIAELIANGIEKACKKHDQSPLFIVALMFRESGFNSLVISKAKCVGLMQINKNAHPNKVKPYKYAQLFHIDTNIDIGCQILKEYSKEAKTPKKLLAKYFGAHNKGYIGDVLSLFAELCLKYKKQI